VTFERFCLRVVYGQVCALFVATDRREIASIRYNPFRPVGVDGDAPKAFAISIKARSNKNDPRNVVRYNRHQYESSDDRGIQIDGR